MPSKARKQFDLNVKDIERLLEFHSGKGGLRKGRRYGLEVLNKSAIVLITSYWEAYCEDLASEALEHIVKHAKSSEVLPAELKKIIAKELKREDHELEVWKLADNGWRKYAEDRLLDLKIKRDRKLNTPKLQILMSFF